MSKRSFISLLLVFVFLFSSFIAFAEEEQVEFTRAEETRQIIINVDGEEVEFLNAKPVIIKGTTLVPLEFIEENLKAEVESNEDNSKVIIKKTFHDLVTKELELSIGNPVVIVREKEADVEEAKVKEVELLTEPKVIDGVPMYALKVIAEELRIKLYWDQEDYTVHIKLPNIHLGKDLPDLEIADSKGEKVQLSNFKGDPFLVVFIGTWCSYCDDLVPIIDEFVEKYSDMPVMIIGIDDTEESMAQYKEKFKTEQEVYLPVVEYGKVLETFGISFVPSLFFVDKDGKVQYFSNFITIEEMEEVMEWYFK